MEHIRKYSREWFAGNGMQDKQREALDKMKKGCDSEPDLFSILNPKTFVGEKEQVKRDFLSKDPDLSHETSLIYKYGGIDSLFDLIDADGDGVVTEEEVNDVLSIDSEELGQENHVFSTRDLRAIYENAMASQDAEVETTDFVDKYKYKDGMTTEVYRDENGHVISKYIEQNSDNNERKGTQYCYDTQIQYNIIKDENGRTRFVEASSKKSKAENYKETTQYDADDKKVITKDTLGRTIVEIYEGENLVSKKQTLKYNTDGVIDYTRQGSIGDCWVLTAVNALGDTKKGAEIIKKSIHQNDDGSVTVELKGVDRKYTFTPEQIGACQYTEKYKEYSVGDIDMNLIEMAIGEYRKELLSNPENANKTEFSDATETDPLEGGYTWSAIEYLTGKKSEVAFKEDKMKEMLKDKQFSNQRYVMSVDFKENDENMGTQERHAYSINRVTRTTVYIIDPHDASMEIACPRDKFLKNCLRISSLDMRK